MRSKRYLARQAAIAAAGGAQAQDVTPSRVQAPATAPLAEPVDSRKRRASMPWVFALVLFTAVAVAFVFRQAEVMAVQRNLAEMEQEIERYKSLNESLQAQLTTLQTDEYIEKSAREKLGLVMPGEIQYMVIDYNGKN